MGGGGERGVGRELVSSRSDSVGSRGALDTSRGRALARREGGVNVTDGMGRSRELFPGVTLLFSLLFLFSSQRQELSTPPRTTRGCRVQCLGPEE